MQTKVKYMSDISQFLEQLWKEEKHNYLDSENIWYKDQIEKEFYIQVLEKAHWNDEFINDVLKMMGY